MPKSRRKEDRGKSRNFLRREGDLAIRELTKYTRRKAGKFLKERKSFLMTQEKQKVVINQKR